MARKINLKGLFETGKLSVSFDLGGENTSSSDGLGAMFDIDPNLTTKFKGDSSGNFGLFGMNLSFNPPIQGNSFRVKTIIRGLNSGSQQALIQPPGLVPQLIRDGVEDDAPNQKLQHNYDFKNGGLPSLGFDGITPRGSLYDLEIFNFEIFVTEEADPYEFNDSVLTTHAWNSSRYDGRQLSGQLINKVRNGDVSYGRTPVIRNLTRTFYISSDIISLSNDGSNDQEIEDTTLQYIPNFSYVMVNKAVTVNDNDIIEVTDLSTFNSTPGGEGIRKREGFDREFQTNVPNGSYIGIKNLDADIKDRSDDGYKVYFNAGRFQPVIRYIQTGEEPFAVSGVNAPQTMTLDTQFNYQAASYTSLSPVPGELEFRNRKRVRQFFTGSISSDKALQAKTMDSFFTDLTTYRDTSPTNPRFFVSLLATSASSSPSFEATDIETIRTVSDEGGYYPTENLAELSTFEINGEHNIANSRVGISSTFGVNQTYQLRNVGGSTTPIAYSGSFDISILNENKPALLVNLNKKNEFPEGIGRTPLVIIPENLHPYIKDNIPQFMAQAGFDIGDITQINTLDETNRTLS